MTNGQPTTDAEMATDENAVAPTTTAPKKQQPTPYDELLCTICGLKACWQAPANAEPTRP